MTLGETQELFVELETRWVRAVLSLPGHRLRHGEGRILPRGPDGNGRKAVHALTGLPLKVEDRVHMKGGTHYLGCGADWNLFVDGEWITNGDSPHWQEVGLIWESLHPLCAWGGRWSDANHISVQYMGKK